MASGPGARGDFLKRFSILEEQVRLLRLRVFGARYVPSPTFIMEGRITTDRFFAPGHVTTDPVKDGALVETKRIVAVEGWLGQGSVDIGWNVNGEVLLSRHSISGSTNYVLLTTPYVVEGFAWVQPEILSASFAYNLACTFILEAEGVA